MSKIAFTICSNNYLAQAKALGDSLSKHNPDYKFVICLCDKKHKDIDYSFFAPYPFIEVQDIGIEKFDKMRNQYNIVELNTSIKPFVFDFLFKTYKNAETVMYFDPDTYVFDNLTPIEDELKGHSILLTPHIYTPIEFDCKTPTENTFTQYGIYNLGFLALKRNDDTNKLLDWWKRRLEVNCYENSGEGIFVDQLPMNFAPLFFDNVKISDNWGLNMAPWNLHERSLTTKDEKYFVNNKYPLVFYHFSNFNPNVPELLSVHYSRVTFEGNDILKKAYDDYRMEVIENKYEKFSKIACFYAGRTSIKDKKKKNIIKRIFNYVKKHAIVLFK